MHWKRSHCLTILRQDLKSLEKTFSLIRHYIFTKGIEPATNRILVTQKPSQITIFKFGGTELCPITKFRLQKPTRYAENVNVTSVRNQF